jgi:hypothetical protein
MAAMGNNCFCYMKNHLHNILKFHITCAFLYPLIFSFNTNINKTKFRYYISTDLLHCIKIFCIHTYYVHLTITFVVGIYHSDSCRCTNLHFLNVKAMSKCKLCPVSRYFVFSFVIHKYLFRYIYHLGDRIVCS